MSLHESGTASRAPLWVNPQGGAEPTMTWSQFLETRERARSLALDAADALLAGPWEGALPGWRMDARLARDAARLLRAHPPKPAPRLIFAALAPRDALPPVSRAAAEPFLHREALERAATAELEPSPRHCLAWSLERLEFLGCRVEDRERRRWAEAPWPADPENDAESATLWAGWFSGNPWSLKRPWDRLYLPEATRVFRAIAADRHLSPEISRRVVTDLREAFFYRMLGGKGTLPGWAELAARVIETAGPGPMDSLLAALPPSDRARLGACAVGRGVWRSSAAAIWRAPGEQTRATLAADALAARPEAVEPWLDAHVVRRLIRAWSAGLTETDWVLVTQNRGRARARTRALLAARGAKLAETVLGLDGLHARTAGALRRLAWGWAWSELARDFSFDLGRPLSMACTPPRVERTPTLDEPGRAALEGWLLLVVLRGRLGHLRRWVSEGRTGDRDSTWGRLLADELPEHLRDEKGEAHYRRLRGLLVGQLDARLGALRPRLQTVSGLAPGRGLRAAFEQEFRPVWPAELAFPRAGFPTFQRNAAEALAALEAT